MKSSRELWSFHWDQGLPSLLFMLVGLIVLPFLVSYAELATEIVCLSLLAVSFNLLFGFSGLLSFCHASLFSVGAYTIGNLMIHFNVNILLGLIAGGIMSAAITIPIGLISIQRLGIYFAFLTLAFNQMVYYIIYQWVSLTGGDEGLRCIFRPDLSLGAFHVDISSPIRFYFFSLIIFMICFYVMRRIVNSPFGSVLKCIRENESRAEAIGYSIKSYKLTVFVISGFFAGVAGALHTMFIKFADVEHCMWIFSGDVVLMTLLGGINSLFGPIFGATVFVLLADTVSVLWHRWLFVMGIIFLICVLFFRGGIQGGLEKLFLQLVRVKRTMKV